MRTHLPFSFQATTLPHPLGMSNSASTTRARVCDMSYSDPHVSSAARTTMRNAWSFTERTDAATDQSCCVTRSTTGRWIRRSGRPCADDVTVPCIGLWTHLASAGPRSLRLGTRLVRALVENGAPGGTLGHTIRIGAIRTRNFLLTRQTP